MLNIINSNVYTEVENLTILFRTATGFPHIVIDNFLDESVAERLLRDFPEITAMYPSRHYIFGSKYELSPWNNISNSFHLLYEELISKRFQIFISRIAGKNLFIDPNLPGAIHQGVNKSYLDIHTDFNIHPYNETWIHSLNVLIYLNKNWKQEYGGDLLLKAGLEEANLKISPQFNRCVIMLSDDTTYHGYNRMTLPQGVTRKSITAQFYKKEFSEKVPRKQTTTWVPSEGSIFKRYVAKLYNPLVLTKNRFFGSSTIRKHELNRSLD